MINFQLSILRGQNSMKIKNCKLKISNKCGFTLMEILIAAGVLGLLAILLGTIFLTQTQYFDDQQVRLLLSGYLDTAFPAMKNLIIWSESILTSYNIQGQNYTSGAETLVLKIPSIDINKKTISGQYDYAAIFKSAADIKIVLSPSAQSSRIAQNRSIAQNTSSFNIDYGGVAPNLAKTVIISMTLTKTAPTNKVITITRSFQATLRNQ